VILALIGWGSWMGAESHFSADREKSIWMMVHGMALLLGSAVVALGFVFGVMYLIQSARLKSKKLSNSGSFRLPSLEWLSGILFAWLVIASLTSIFYRPARHGRKVAMLVSASFLFLVLELGIVWWSGHASSSQTEENRDTVTRVDTIDTIHPKSIVVSQRAQS